MIRHLILCCCLAGSASASAPIIENPADPPVRREVTFTEVWRAGTDEGEEFLFGVIGDAVCDPAGNIYLLDAQQQCVFKFTSGGEYLGIVSRKGEGPGEIDRVYSLGMLGRDGIAMLKSFPAEVIVVDTAGVPRPGIHPEPPRFWAESVFSFVTRFENRDGLMVCSGLVSHAMGEVQDQTQYLASLGPEGDVLHCYGSKRGGYDFTRPITVDEIGDHSPIQVWTVGRDGEIYLAPDRDRWLVEVRDAWGGVLRLITRDWAPHLRTDQEKEKVKDGYSFSSNGQLPPISYRIADTDPAISSLGFRNGELWIQSPDQGRDLPEGVAARYDVFDPAGRLQVERSLRIPFDPQTDKLIFLDNGWAVVVQAFRSAHLASSADLQIQEGEKRLDGADLDAEILEVVVYRPD
ncbi:MAG: hypothetical protein AB7V45_04330 [Candidatus Krumholzibacteriia bacterium]